MVKKGLKDFLYLLAAVIILGYIIGRFADPFIYLLYYQLAYLFILIILIKTNRKDPVTLPLLVLSMAAHAFNLTDISVLLGIAFIILFLGRNAIEAFRWRRIFTVASTVLFVFVFGLFLLLSRTSARPLVDHAPQFNSVESLPYLSYVKNETAVSKKGVVLYDRNLSAPGLNLYNSYYRAGAYLLDMSGNVLHAWRSRNASSDWQYVTPCANGDLLVCVEEGMLMRLDWDSHVLWQRKMRAHHDIAVADNGDIYTLTRAEELVSPFVFPVPIIDDFIEILSGQGTPIKKISLYNILRDEISRLDVTKIYYQIIDPQDYLWRIIKQERAHRNLLRPNTPFDIFHNNTITLMDKDIPGVCRKGDVLISASNLNLIGIIDIDKETLVWSWGPGTLEHQHNPTVLENGHILVFDNGTKRGYSRLLELDPRSKEIVWEYHSLQPASFFSSWGGTAQRLDNGNTLVTDSSEGEVFEIDKAGDIVWEFINPDEEDNGKRATIYCLTRITDPHLESILWENVEEDWQW